MYKSQVKLIETESIQQKTVNLKIGYGLINSISGFWFTNCAC